MLEGSESNYAPQMYAGHAFTAIDINDDGVLYACDDTTGALCAISPGSNSARALIDGAGYHSVHVNGDVISLCDNKSNEVVLCETSGTVNRTFAILLWIASFLPVI